MKRIDIIIPVHDTPSTLLRSCFDSVKKQTYTNSNIIVVDDGSTSVKTKQLLKEHAEHKKCQLIEQPNLGVSSARNSGLKHSHGDYVLFVDSDDYLDQDYLYRLILCAEKENYDLVFSGKVNCKTKRNDAPFFHKRINIDTDANVMTLKSQAFTSQGVLIRGDIARKNTFTTTTTMGEDTEYILKCMQDAKCYFDGSGGYNYVQHSASITHNLSNNSIERYLDESIILANTLKKYVGADDDTLNIFKLLKLSRASRKIAKNKSTYKYFIDIARKYINQANVCAISTKKILTESLLSKGEKIKIILLNHRSFRTFFILNRIIVSIKE